MEKFQGFINSLYHSLGDTLPGEEAHLKMAPYKRDNAKTILKSDIEPRIASVLLLLHAHEQSINFTLIKRPNYEGTHGGQISFPGGKLEQNETVKEAAIRETEEEIGIPKHEINILGELTQVYIPPSNFLISPFVGFIDTTPNYFPDEREVEQVLDISLNALLDDENVKTKKIPMNKYGKKKLFINAPYFELNNQTVWGATALVLSEFKEIVRQF